MKTREEKAMLDRAARLGDIALARIRMIGYCDARFESHSLIESAEIEKFVETHEAVELEWHDPIWRTPDLAPMIVEVHLR